jgi:hypothetical protein
VGRWQVVAVEAERVGWSSARHAVEETEINMFFEFLGNFRGNIYSYSVYGDRLDSPRFRWRRNNDTLILDYGDVSAIYSYNYADQILRLRNGTMTLVLQRITNTE